MARVSMWGPNAQGVRRPDRSVSLSAEGGSGSVDWDNIPRIRPETGPGSVDWDNIPRIRPETGPGSVDWDNIPPADARDLALKDLEDVNELPVQRAGPIWFYGGYGNPPQKQAGPDMWVGSEDYPELAGAVEKTAAAEGKTVDPDNPEEVMKWLGNKPTWVEIQPDGTVVEVPEPDPEAWVPDPEAAAPESDPMPDVQPDPGPSSLLRQGLTADQAFQQHMAMSGSGQEHLPGMEPEPDSRPPWAPTDKQRAAGKEWIPKVRKTMAGSQAPPPSSERIASPLVSRMSGPNFDAIEEGDYGTTPWWDSVPGLDDLPEFDDPYGDELEQMDFRGREQAAWDSAGLGSASDPSFNMFGGMGEVVQGLTDRLSQMSNKERTALVAALVGAGLLTVGTGGMLVPAGAALMGGAGMAAMN
jgi:hypothetical protein